MATKFEQNNRYPRGSEWRRWDLHIHTKGTNKRDQFTSTTFDDFCVDLFTKALVNEIAVIGITDYFSIENYHKVVSFVSNIDTNTNFNEKQKKQIKEILILPNVELRMIPVTDRGRLINIHCIFNNDSGFLTSLENIFFSSIKYSTSSGKYSMNRQGLLDFGKSLDSSLSDDEAYKKGVDNFVISHGDLQKILDENPSFKDNTVIIVSNSSCDGASALQQHYDFFEDTDPGSLEALRKSIYSLSSCIFSGNPEDKKYFLGQKIDTSEKVIEKCGSVKPCIHGSDAHTEGELFLPSENRYCWIKADPTFEGLKQIIYEPEDRVSVQETKPEQKEDYQIIDKVKFSDDKFTTDFITLSQNLTAIIGGRSTGKSILLRNIAQTIDPIQVSRRLSEVNLRDYSIPVRGFQVVWRDEQEYEKNRQEENFKKIIYIPQSYLNRLVDKKEDKTAIDDIIRDILEQESETRLSFEKLENKQRDIEKKLSNAVNEVFFLEKDILDLTNQIRSVGDKKGIDKEIKKIKLEIEKIKNDAGMSKAEILEYNKLHLEIKKISAEKEKIKLDILGLNAISEIPIFNDIDFSELSLELAESLLKKYDQVVEKITGNWWAEIDILMKELKKKHSELDEKYKLLNIQIIPLIEKVKASTILSKKVENLKDEESKLEQIIKSEGDLKKKEKNYKQLINEIADSHSEFYKNIFSVKSEILKQTVISGEISFDIIIEFKLESFKRDFVELCNLKTIGQFESGLLNDYKFQGVEQFKNDVLKIVMGILSNLLILKSGFSREEVIRKLLQNWFIFDYKIKQNGDEISTMSPGKKSFVLLKLLIELDRSKCPILLDQPEDDLDNRSIYNDLVKFIVNKKKFRQIIIATHNPNLVVGADSECVIVANQGGDQTKNKIFPFEYVSGSLENTFLDKAEERVLYSRGIQEHVCDILEGGRTAFEQRKKKYNIKN
jgi:ABC-type cobalamin/Fe3+-siderophores transport system ATPase subunit